MAKGVVVCEDGEVTSAVVSGLDMVCLCRTLARAWQEGYIDSVTHEGGMMTLRYNGLRPHYERVGGIGYIGYMVRTLTFFTMDARLGACIFDELEDASPWDNYLASFEGMEGQERIRGLRAITPYFSGGANKIWDFSRLTRRVFNRMGIRPKSWKYNRLAQYQVREV